MIVFKKKELPQEVREYVATIESGGTPDIPSSRLFRRPLKTQRREAFFMLFGGLGGSALFFWGAFGSHEPIEGKVIAFIMGLIMMLCVWFALSVFLKGADPEYLFFFPGWLVKKGVGNYIVVNSKNVSSVTMLSTKAAFSESRCIEVEDMEGAKKKILFSVRSQDSFDGHFDDWIRSMSLCSGIAITEYKTYEIQH